MYNTLQRYKSFCVIYTINRKSLKFLCFRADYNRTSGQTQYPPLRFWYSVWFQPLRHCRGSVTSTLFSSARQTFPSGWTPAVKDCFGLHGHYAFGSVAKEKSGVGRKSATSVGLTTDLVHWLQAGKTVAVVRFASKIHRLASAFRTASALSVLESTFQRPDSCLEQARSVSGRPQCPGHQFKNLRSQPLYEAQLLDRLLRRGRSRKPS